MQLFQESRRWLRVLLPGAGLTGFLISAVYVDATTVAGFTTSLAVAAGVAAALVGIWGFLRRHTRKPPISKPACVVRLDGRLDARVAKSHRTMLNELILRGHVNFVFDCRRVTFIDSTGLSVLIATQKAIDPAHGAIALAHLEEHLRELFEVTKLDSRFSIHHDVEQALEKLGWEADEQVSPLQPDSQDVPRAPIELT
jgi:anti-sigma B factor antagonist